MRILVALLALMVALSPAPGRAQDVAPPTWLGITFEAPAAQLRATLGDPVRLTVLPQAMGASAPAGGIPERKARYVLSLTGLLFLIVSERQGAVVGLEVFSAQPLTSEVASVAPDPSGVSLGATEAAVLKAHPDARRTQTADGMTLVAPWSRRYLAAYSFEGGRVTAIDWFARASTDSSRDGPALSEPAGDSPETAILDVQKTEGEGVDWERLWQRFHPCDGTTQWLKSSVATSLQNGRRYDAVTLKCPTTGATRIVYFDITAFFGKL